MRWGTLAFVALVACTGAPAQEPEFWDAPRARMVSDLGQFDERHSYNEYSTVSDGGRWVVFNSHVKDRPGRIFLVDTKKRTLRQIDGAHDRGRRVSKGVRRNSLTDIDPQITPDGRYVVFSSGFSNLVRRDSNDAVDIFRYDRVARRTAIVSRSGGGEQANLGSYSPTLSSDGRFVVFHSRATNLVPEDRDFRSDVYRKDLHTGRVELVSIGSQGKGNAWSTGADVSDDGARISFGSHASNLVDDDTNGLHDIFVRDMEAQETLRVSVTSDGEQYESFESEESASVYHATVHEGEISGNGEVVVFSGNANRLVEEDVNYNDDVFVHDISTRVTERVSVRSDGGDAYDEEGVECGKDPVCAQFISTHSPSISADGTHVYFVSAAPLLSSEDEDRGGSSQEQVFVRDRGLGVTLLASRYRDGSPVESTNWYGGAISADGEWVTYSNNSMKLDGRRGDQDPGPDVFLQRLPD